MAGKGSKPGERRGGRKKGTPNKATTMAAIKAKVAASGELPLDFMLREMRNEKNKLEFRAQMARAAAPYLHPALSAVAVRQVGADGKPIAPQVNINIVSADAKPAAVSDSGTKLIDARPSGTSH